MIRFTEAVKQYSEEDEEGQEVCQEIHSSSGMDETPPLIQRHGQQRAGVDRHQDITHGNCR